MTGADDLAAYPWAYPGTPAPGAGILQDGRFTPAPAADLLSAAGLPSTAGRFSGARPRTPVVAVGSNASPTVINRKLGRHGVTGDVPLLPGTLHGCGVGHSAHVSAPGYVPAAPFVAAHGAAAVWVTLLDEAQVRCLDLTEPGYVRRRVPSDVCVLETDGGSPATFDVYDGRWGVLAPPDEPPVPLGIQTALFDLLRARWSPYSRLLGDADSTDECRRVTTLLAADRGLRRGVREAFASTGWARPSGLDFCAPAGP